MKLIKKILRRKKLSALILVYAVAIVLVGFYSITLSLAFLTVGILLFAALCVTLVLNKLLKKTNWYKNSTALATDFISNAGYRENLQRNFDIVNVGSNPARFAFFYEDVRGQNWATGSQGLDMDLEVLRFYHSFMREGATVILPIVPFSSVSGYLEKLPAQRGYLERFAQVLDGLQVKYNPKFKGIQRKIRYPLFYNPKAVIYIFHDVEKDNRLSINENHMQLVEMQEDARRWIENCWKPEFSISNLHDELREELKEGFELSVKMMTNTIQFLRERGYKPVIVSPPMSKALGKYFTPDVKERFVTSFARRFEAMGVQYLDYMHDEEFSKHEYYFNALFMNLRGRKLFTKRVMKDLGLIK